MSTSPAVNSLAICIQANKPVLLLGKPGEGKTSIISALGRVLKRHTEIVISAIREPSDFSGLPVISDGGVTLHAPTWVHRLNKSTAGLLFLDEVPDAPPAVQSALLRVVLDRWVGDTQLQEHVSVVAAGNPAEISAAGWELSPPLANRFVHLGWSPQVTEWVDGMLSGFVDPKVPILPETWRDNFPLNRSMIASFIKTKPSAASIDFKKKREDLKGAWPSYRTWEMAALLLTAAEAAKCDMDTTTTLLSGCVGPGAIEFLTWRRQADLPDPDVLLNDPSKFKLPERGDQVFAVLAAVTATAAMRITTTGIPKEKAKTLWANAWNILHKVAKGGHKDLVAVHAKTLMVAQKQFSWLPTPTAEFQELLPLFKASGHMN